MDLAIAIRIGSPKSSLFLVKQTIESIQKNIGKCRYRFILSLDPQIPQEVKDYIVKKQKEFPENFEVFPEENLYWAEFINKAIESAQDCEYFIQSHDDLELMTPDFFPTVKKILASLKEAYAWVSFTPIDYFDGYYAPPTRCEFYKDFVEENGCARRKMFQFHRLPEGWWKVPLWKRLPYLIQQKIIVKILPFFQVFSYQKVKMSEEYLKMLDFPSGPVKCPTPWNNFALIKTEVLNKIGPCENWQTYHALLVDQDWGLSAAQLKYWNIWIPSVEYLHHRPNVGGDRAQYQIKRDAKRVHALFEKKWGFHSQSKSQKQLEWIKSQHKDNFIPWSINRNSYDWDYIK